jgi:hypothetical protein
MVQIPITQEVMDRGLAFLALFIMTLREEVEEVDDMEEVLRPEREVEEVQRGPTRRAVLLPEVQEILPMQDNTYSVVSTI